MAAIEPERYATVDEYRARVVATSSASDFEIEQQLSAASRLIDRWCQRWFGKSTTAQTRLYDGGPGLTTFAVMWADLYPLPYAGSMRLYLEDEIATTTGLVVKIDQDGDHVFETTMVLNTDYWVGPPNAQLDPEPRPYVFLEIVPRGVNGIGVWPSNKRSVQVTAYNGWPTVPYAIREATVMLAREIRDLQEAGATLTIQQIDTAIRQGASTGAASLMMQVVQAYGKRRKGTLFA